MPVDKSTICWHPNRGPQNRPNNDHHWGNNSFADLAKARWSNRQRKHSFDPPKLFRPSNLFVIRVGSQKIVPCYYSVWQGIHEIPWEKNARDQCTQWLLCLSISSDTMTQVFEVKLIMENKILINMSRQDCNNCYTTVHTQIYTSWLKHREKPSQIDQNVEPDAYINANIYIYTKIYIMYRDIKCR